MKKFLIFIFAALIALTAMPLFGCNEQAMNGETDADYRAVDEQSYQKIVSLIDENSPVKGTENVFGGILSSDLELTFKVGEKSMTAMETETLKLLFSNDKLYLALTGNANVKADDKFLDETVSSIFSLMEIQLDENPEIPDIGMVNVMGEANAYYDDENLYLDAKVTGITENQKDLFGNVGIDVDKMGLAEGIKYKFENAQLKSEVINLIQNMKDGLSRGLSELKKLDYTTLKDYLTLFDIKMYVAEKETGVKVKLETSTTTAAKIKAWANEHDENMRKTFESFNVDKLDVNICFSFDSYGKLDEISMRGDIKSNVIKNQTKIDLGISGSANLSLTAPAIQLPSFEDFTFPGENGNSMGNTDGDSSSGTTNG